MSFSGAHRLGVGGSGVPENVERPPSSDLSSTAASGDRGDQAEVADHHPAAEGGAGKRPALENRRAGAERLPQPEAVDFPWLWKMSVTTPPFGSKNSSLTLLQPPNFSIVEQIGRGRVGLLVDETRNHRAVALLRQIPSGPASYCCVVDELLVRLGAWHQPWNLSIGFWIRIVWSGNHVIDVLALLLCGDRLVLVGQQHVTLTAGECLQRLTSTLVLNRNVLEQCLSR